MCTTLSAICYSYGYTQSLINNDSKLILIHLDGVSSYYLMEEMDKGNLPNLEAFFNPDQRIKFAITYFPSKTPTVISSIRQGMSLEDAILPGWERVNADEVKTGIVSTFLKMAFSKSRLAVTNLLYGVPLLYRFAGPALVNTADYLKDYNILEFYWYRIDSEGHFRGEESYKNEMAIFDKHFGRLAKRVDDDVNIIIYSDHGMSFGNGIQLDDKIEELMGDDFNLFAYPTLFLKDRHNLQNYAEKLVYETELDFAFYQIDNGDIVGIHDEGEIYFSSENEFIKYDYSGYDALRYYANGYQGEYWNKEQWLSFSHNLDYPFTPLSLYYFLQNPNSGDIVALFEEGNFLQTGYSRNGNHGGITKHEMITPLFVKGPEIDELYGLDYFWLPDLFNEIEGINFNQQPPRERHFTATRYDFRNNRQVTQLSFSPNYRIRYGANLYADDLFNLSKSEVWGKVDFYRSYLVRMWLGTGVDISDSEIKPLLFIQHDLHIRKFLFQSSFATNRKFYFTTSWEVLPWLAIESVNFNSLGVRFDF